MAERLSARDGAVLLELARASIQDAVAGEDSVRALVPRVEISAALEALRGVFVTLHSPSTGKGRGDLRGCIGTLIAALPLYRNVIATAPRSALDDPRFPPVSADEVRSVSIEVSALTPPESIGSIEAIVVGRDGVELTAHGRHAVFLPQVAAERGWTVTQLLRHLSKKAGLHPDAWREADLRVFQAEIFEEALSRGQVPGGGSKIR